MEKADDPAPAAMMIDVAPVAHRPEAIRIVAALKVETGTAHDDQMARRNHAENQNVAVVRKVETLIVRVGQKVHLNEVIPTVEARRTNAMVVVIEDRADLQTWIVNADLQKAATLNVDQAVVMPKVARHRAVTNHAVLEKVAPAVRSQAKAEEHRFAEAMAEINQDLRCEADGHRSLVADLAQADLRGCRDVKADRHSVVAHRSAEVLREWGHHGHNVASHPVADRRSATVDQVAHRWDHQG